MKLNDYLKRSVNAFILAGGKGRRLTYKKSLIRIDNKPIIENTVCVLSSIFKNVSIISNNKNLYSYLNLKIYSDIFLNSGPKGGIYSGLYNSQTEWNFFVACDMPFVSEEVILKLSQFLSDKYDCVVPFINNYYEPLFAFYNRNCLREMGNSLKSGDNKIQNSFGKLKIKRVTETELGNSIDINKAFININTKSDLINLRKSMLKE